MAGRLLHSKTMSPPAMPLPSMPSNKEPSEHADRDTPTGSMVLALELRERIARDHALLRSLTRALLGAAKAAEADEKQRYVIREILAQLLDETERHFAYEERITAPLLRRAEVWGPICAQRMTKEHDEQRTTLRAIAEDAQDGVRTIDELTEEIRWFFRRFEQDMSDEEERLLSAARSVRLSVVPSAEPPPASRATAQRR